jgi:hypothetical protein
MKKLILILSLVFAVLSSSSAQQEIKLNLGCELLDAVENNNGAVILTGNYYLLARHHWILRYINSDLSVRYEMPLKNNSVSFFNTIISSASGNNVYLIQGRPNFFTGKLRENLLHLDSMGAYAPVKMKKRIDNSLINAIFADDNYLYFISYSEKKRKRRNDVDSSSGMKFIRIDNHDFSETEVNLELPKPADDFTSWKYIGNTKFVSYFTSRKVIDAQKQEYRIAVLNKDGKMLDDFKFETAVTTGPMLGANSNFYIPGAQVVHSNQYKVLVTTSGKYTTITYIENPEALGNILFDPASNGFFVYGMLGTSVVQRAKFFKPRKLIQNATGYYIYHFNEDGKLTWKNENKLVGVNEEFRNNANFVSREVNIQPGPGGLKFSMYTGKNVTCYDIDPKTGKLVKGYSNGFEHTVSYVDLGTCRKTGEKSQMSKYLSKPDRNICSRFVFRTLDGYIVLKNYFMDHKIELDNFPLE